MLSFVLCCNFCACKCACTVVVWFPPGGGGVPWAGERQRGGGYRFVEQPPPRIIVVVGSPCQENYPADAHPSVHKSVLESANPRMDSEWASGCPGSTARATAPSPGQPTPGVVKQDKSSGGSVDTTKTRSGPQRVRMSGGERPIGAARGVGVRTLFFPLLSPEGPDAPLCPMPLPLPRRICVHPRVRPMCRGWPARASVRTLKPL